MAKKKTSSHSPSTLPRRLLKDLAEADRLLESKKPEQARQILEELDRQRDRPIPVGLAVREMLLGPFAAKEA